MPIYPHKCESCGETKDHYAKMDDCEVELKCSNGHDMQRVYGRVNVEVFKPYLEDGFTGSDILIETKAQRDALLKEHGLNLDNHLYLRKPKVTTAIDDLTLGDVQEAMKAGLTDQDDHALREFIDEGKA